MGTEQKFDINDGNAGSIFKEKVNSIFGCLDDLEQKHWEKCEQVIEKSCANEPVDNPMNKRSNHVPRSQEKDFKKPFLPRGKRRGKKPPDYVTNPSKWTKYSLKEDGTRHAGKGLTADQLNKKVALDFISELRNRKQTCDVETNKSDTKMAFKKPVSQPNEKSRSSVTYGGCHSAVARVMETYEFGQKIKKSNRGLSKSLVRPGEESDIMKDRNTNTQKVQLDFSCDGNIEKMETVDNDDENNTFSKPADALNISQFSDKEDNALQKAIFNTSRKKRVRNIRKRDGDIVDTG